MLPFKTTHNNNIYAWNAINLHTRASCTSHIFWITFWHVFVVSWYRRVCVFDQTNERTLSHSLIYSKFVAFYASTKRSLYGTLFMTFVSAFSAINVNASKIGFLISLKMSRQFSFKNKLVLSPSALSPLYRFLKSKWMLCTEKWRKWMRNFVFENDIWIIVSCLLWNGEYQMRLLYFHVFFSITPDALAFEVEHHIRVGCKNDKDHYTHWYSITFGTSANIEYLHNVMFWSPSPWMGRIRTRPEIW